MKTFKQRIFFHIQFVILLVLSLSALGQGLDKYLPERPSPPRLVNDYLGLLSSDQRDALEKKLTSFDDSSSTQIVVITMGDIGGNELSEFAVELGRKWGVGNKEFNNGVVLAVLIDSKRNQRNVFIATGYGLEGVIPDYTAKAIIENEVLPNFRTKDIYRGLDEGTDAIIKAASGKYKAPDGYGKRKKKNVPGWLVIVIFILIVLMVSRGGRGGGGMVSRRGYRRFNQTPPIFWFPSGGGRSSWGGGGGGGFGGFGGGGFGGGGAGGSW
jgi:uncharacterized protein